MDIPSFLDVGADGLRCLSKIEAELFIRCLVADRQELRPFADAEAEEIGLRGQTLYQKLVWADAEASLPVALFACYMSRGRHENLLMWAYTLTVLNKKLGRVVRTDDLVRFFPKGFPNDKGEKSIWDKQKDGNHNRLDTRQIWQSAMKSED